MGKRSQSFWVETHVIIVSLLDKLHLFLDCDSQTVGDFAFLAAVGFLAYC